MVDKELPAAVISGQNRSLVMGEKRSHTPFSDFVPLRKKLLTLEDYGIHFTRSNSIFAFVCPNMYIPPAMLPFHEPRLDLDCVLRLICSTSKCLQRRNLFG